MKTTVKIAATALAGLGIAASAAVLGHGRGPMMGQGPMMHQGADGAGPWGRCIAGGPEAHLSALKTELKLTAAQEPAWKAFEGAVRAQAEGRAKDHPQAAGGPESFDAHIAFMEQRLAGLKAVAQARTGLYAVLTPEQKAVADRLLPGPHARHARRD
jgi:hypothetical protein